MEQKYQIGNDYGSIMWDITKMLDEISNYNKCKFSVEKLVANNSFYGDEAYAMSTDLLKPLIVVNLADNIDKLIDGNHRLFKAKQLGMKEMECYYLLQEEHTKYIVDYDAEIYEAVTKNWK